MSRFLSSMYSQGSTGILSFASSNCLSAATLTNSSYNNLVAKKKINKRNNSHSFITPSNTSNQAAGFLFESSGRARWIDTAHRISKEGVDRHDKNEIDSISFSRNYACWDTQAIRPLYLFVTLLLPGGDNQSSMSNPCYLRVKSRIEKILRFPFSFFDIDGLMSFFLNAINWATLSLITLVGSFVIHVSRVGNKNGWTTGDAFLNLSIALSRRENRGSLVVATKFARTATTNTVHCTLLSNFERPSIDRCRFTSVAPLEHCIAHSKFTEMRPRTRSFLKHFVLT